MEKNNTTSAINTNPSDDSSHIIVIASLSLFFTILGMIIFFLAVVYYKKNKRKKKYREIKRLRTIFKKNYVDLKKKESFSQFSLKIISNFTSQIIPKVETSIEEKSKNNIIEFKTLNNIDDNNKKIDFSHNNVIEIKKQVIDIEKKTENSSNDITSFSIKPLLYCRPTSSKDTRFQSILNSLNENSSDNDNKFIKYKEDMRNIKLTKPPIPK